MSNDQTQNAESGAWRNPNGTLVEPVVSTTYNVVCPVHGVLAYGQTAKEAASYSRCERCQINGSGSDKQ